MKELPSWMLTMTDEQKVAYIREQITQIERQCEKMAAWNEGVMLMMKFGTAAFQSR